MEEQKQTQTYVLFPNHHSGIQLHRELKKLGIRAVIAPTPRTVSTCCGISLLIKKDDIETVEKCIRDNEVEILRIVDIEKDINPGRDRYC